MVKKILYTSTSPLRSRDNRKLINKLRQHITITVEWIEKNVFSVHCNGQFCWYVIDRLGKEKRCSCLYPYVRCLFDFTLLPTSRILDVHEVKLDRTEQNELNLTRGT
jgi:hypothetical protein